MMVREREGDVFVPLLYFKMGVFHHGGGVAGYFTSCSF